MTIQVPKDIENSIQIAVSRGLFASVDDAMTEAARLLLRSLDCKGDAGSASDEHVTSPKKPIWEQFQEISARVPPEVWDDVPTDLSEEHDHYVYGTPKRNGA